MPPTSSAIESRRGLRRDALRDAARYQTLGRAVLDEA